MKPSSIGGPQLDPEYQSSSSLSPSSSSTSPSSSKYKGVRKRKWGKWVSEIRLPNSRERIWLGSYDSPEKAARAFDAALFCLRGRNAKFNFPSSPPDIPDAENLTQQEIQGVAARFANEHPGSTSEVEAGINEEPKPCTQGSEGGGMDWSFLGALDEIDRGKVSGTGFIYDYDEVDDYLNGTHHMDSNVRDRHGIDDHDNDDHGGGDCVSDDDYTHQTSFLWNF